MPLSVGVDLVQYEECCKQMVWVSSTTEMHIYSNILTSSGERLINMGNNGLNTADIGRCGKSFMLTLYQFHC